MSNSIQTQPSVIEGREPPAEVMEPILWAREVVQKRMTVLQEALKQMITLSTALLAGSTALLAQLPIAWLCKVIGAGLLMVCLASSLLGFLPHNATLDTTDPDHIQTVRAKALKWRWKCLCCSAGSLFAAFFFLLVGLLFR